MAEIEEKCKEHIVLQQDKNVLRCKHKEILWQQETIEWEQREPKEQIERAQQVW